MEGFCSCLSFVIVLEWRAEVTVNVKPAKRSHLTMACCQVQVSLSPRDFVVGFVDVLLYVLDLPWRSTRAVMLGEI